MSHVSRHKCLTSAGPHMYMILATGHDLTQFYFVGVGARPHGFALAPFSRLKIDPNTHQICTQMWAVRERDSCMYFRTSSSGQLL
jgi:hypothetical protein